MATVTTEVTGTNLNDYGDTGTFESAYSGVSWGNYFGVVSIHASSVHLSRSSTYAHSGTYSLKIIKDAAVTTNLNSIKNLAHVVMSSLKKYRIRAWVYVDSTYAPTSTGFLRATEIKLTSSFGTVTFPVNRMVGDALDTWVQIEGRFQAPGVSSTEVFFGIQSTLFGVTTEVHMYVDDFEIKEVVDNNVNYDLQGTVTNAAGPTALGSIVLAGVPADPGYYYNIYGGLSTAWQSSGTFNNVAPGTYNCAMKLGVLGSTLVNKSFTVGVNTANFTIQLSGTNETTPGANDGSILVIVSGSGAPFQYKNGRFGSYGSGNLFSSLAPGRYTIYVKDTNGNEKSASITLTAAVTCAIGFRSSQTVITDATEGQADGSIQVIARDATFGGTPYYKLNSDFTYPNGDNSTGLFENLVAGTYTVYARTSTTCRTVGTFTIKSISEYSPRYRLDFEQVSVGEFYDKNNTVPSYGANSQFRLDIEERYYTGSVTDVDGYGVSPVIHSWRGDGIDNPFDLTLIGSELQVTLNSPSNLYFNDLYTSDERKFRFKLYIYDTWTSAYSLIFQGFSVVMNYSEPYQSTTKYPVTFIASDGLADLGKKEFTDDSGNYISGRTSVLNALAICLRKTGNNLNIYDKVNLYTADMLSANENGSLEQRYFDVSIYQKADGTFESCAYVLQNLLKGCQLYQANGVWHVQLWSDKCNNGIQAQVYNNRGEYQNNFLENNRYLLRNSKSVSPKLYTSGTPGLKISETFGTVEVTYDLGIEEENNILDYGTFEAVDLQNGQLNGWTVTKSVEVGGITYGLEKQKKETGSTAENYAFYAQFGGLVASPTIQDQVLKLQSTWKEIEWPGSSFIIRFSFDVYTRPYFTDPYIFLDYSLVKNGSTGLYYMQPKEVYVDTEGHNIMLDDSAALIENNFIRTYIDTPLQWKTVSHEVIINDADQCGTYQVYFSIKSNAVYDVTSLANLQAITTDGIKSVQTYNNRRRAKDTDNGVDVIREYRLRAGTKATSSPDILRPNDYASSTNQFYWELQKTYPMPALSDGITSLNLAEWLQNILIDNVRLEYLPNETDPQTSITKTETINENTPTKIEETTLHGDVYYSEDLDLGGQEIDPNYVNIMRGHWTLFDGSPTYGGWFRRGVTESKWYHELLAKMIRGQFTVARWQISGELITRERLLSYLNTIHEVRTGRVYVPISLEVDYRSATANISMRESVKGEAVDDTSGADVDIPTPDPSTDEGEATLGQHSLQFSAEFD